MTQLHGCAFCDPPNTRWQSDAGDDPTSRAFAHVEMMVHALEVHFAGFLQASAESPTNSRRLQSCRDLLQRCLVDLEEKSP